jgi:hypothetical protein
MDPWTAIAKAIVYPLAKAIADAWFDARAKYESTTEEKPTDEDHARADRIRDAVKRMQLPTQESRDTGSINTPPSSNGDNR